MTTWQIEVANYTGRLEQALKYLSVQPPRPLEVPHGPLDRPPSPLQIVLHRAVTFYELGLWVRARETLHALICLFENGYLSPSAALVRLLFELWGASRYQSDAIDKFRTNRDLGEFAEVGNRLFEGVREEVLMPWGEAAPEKPIHVMDIIRGLKGIFPDAESVYADLCESAHANQPRFLEWWHLGRLGDNWTNETVQVRGRKLLARTVAAAERAVEGIAIEARHGLKACGELYVPA